MLAYRSVPKPMSQKHEKKKRQTPRTNPRRKNIKSWQGRQWQWGRQPLDKKSTQKWWKHGRIGGWTNPFEKCAQVKYGNLPQVGMKIKKKWNHHLVEGFATWISHVQLLSGYWSWINMFPAVADKSWILPVANGTCNRFLWLFWWSNLWMCVFSG